MFSEERAELRSRLSWEKIAILEDQFKTTFLFFEKFHGLLDRKLNKICQDYFCHLYS